MLAYTKSEEFVYKLLRSLYIKDPNQLTIENISNLLNLPIRYWEFSSESVCKNDKYIIFLERKGSKQKQWQEFAHELCHIFWHAGRQEQLPPMMYSLQETQADYFSYHLCIPTFMIDGLKMPKYFNEAVPFIADKFNVELNFAATRLERWMEKKRAFAFQEVYCLKNLTN